MQPLRHYLESYDMHTVHGITDVRDMLIELDAHLAQSDLAALRSFNTAYRLVTDQVLAALHEHRFMDQTFLAAFDIRFVSYYVEALRSYVLFGSTVTAWQSTFDAARSGHASSIKVMALGVNAHVNNDIPQVLRDCAARFEHFRDYRIVNGVIDQTLNEIMDMTVPQIVHSLHLQIPFRFCYRQAMRVLIRSWRLQAWLLYRQLDRQMISRRAIERQAALVSRGTSVLLT